MDLLIAHKFLGNDLFDWLRFILFTALIFLGLTFLKSFFQKKIERFANHTPKAVSDFLLSVIQATSKILLFVVAIYFGSQNLELPSDIERLLLVLFKFAVIIQGGLWASITITQALEGYVKTQHGEDPSALSALDLLRFASTGFVWIAVVLLCLDNAGVNITALVAGLGIGGVAIALAVQNILGDLFSSLSIVLDRPFAVGDFIVVGDLRGTVEKIGIKTTRLRSLDGDQLIFSNSDLLGSRIRNYKRMQQRRIQFNIGVTYQTEPEKLKKITTIIQETIVAQANVKFDRCHFKEFGPSSLNFEIVYFVLSQEMVVYLQAQEKINFEIMDRFSDLGIEFAYPTQTLFVESVGKDRKLTMKDQVLT